MSSRRTSSASSRAAEEASGLLVMSGSGDRLMAVPVMRRLAAFYRAAFSQPVGEKEIEDGDGAVAPLEGEGDMDNVGHGVRFCLVPAAGHHLQNDVQWAVGAKKLLSFYEQV